MCGMCELNCISKTMTPGDLDNEVVTPKRCLIHFLYVISMILIGEFDYPRPDGFPGISSAV